MSDFEYEDDLDILTSLLDEEDDEEEKLRKKVKTTSSCSSSASQKRYVNKPTKTSEEPKSKRNDESRKTSAEITTRSGESSTANLELGDERKNLPGKPKLCCFNTNFAIFKTILLHLQSVNIACSSLLVGLHFGLIAEWHC